MDERKSAGAEKILAYVETHGIVRKDDTDCDTSGSRHGHSRRKGGKRATVDLHGLHADDAKRRLRFAIEDCRRRGIRELLVIHGHGLHSDPQAGPVLKSMVRDLLDRDFHPMCRTYRGASKSDGGEGATVVTVNFSGWRQGLPDRGC